MKNILVSLFLCCSISQAKSTVKFNFKSEDLQKIVETYANATGQKFIIDASVRGKVTILNTDEVTHDEAFNQLSSALATQGYAISKQGDMMVVQPARVVQRSLIEVSTELPALKPERMFTWILTVKNVSADSVVSEMRNITSRDGDINTLSQTNQIMMTDWTSNLHRFAELMKVVDRPVEPAVKKFVEENMKWMQERRRAQRPLSPTKEKKSE